MRCAPAVRVLVAACALAHAPAAGAQILTESTTAFSIERFAPGPGPTDFWAVQDGDVLPHLAYSLGLSLSLMSRPIVLKDLVNAQEVIEPVRTRLGMELGAALGLGRRYQVGLAVPVVAYQEGDRVQGIGLDERALAAFALGDVRLAGKARLVGTPGARGSAVAAAFALGLPTGNDDHFAGDRGAIIEMHLLGSWRSPWLSAGVDLGARIRTVEVTFLSPARPHGNELVGALAVAAVIPGLPRRALSAALEYTHVRGDARPSSSVRGPSPGEARAGLRWTLASGLSIGVAGGAGTTPDDVGSPAWRFIASVRFDTHPTTDLDRDGVIDGQDRCRLEPEDHDGFQDSDGCPDPDNDGDGYPDDADDCPDEPEDFDGYRDVDGCPDAGQRRAPAGENPPQAGDSVYRQRLPGSSRFTLSR